jgi:tetratricopeptide (TPR) repeat protein
MALAESSADALAWFQIGARARAAGDIAEAERALRRCVAIAPYFDVGYDTLAAMLDEAGAGDRALDVLESWERHVAGLGDVRFRIGTAYLRRGDYEQARTWFDRGLNSVVAAGGERLLPFATVSLPRLVHDAAQLRWLIERGRIEPSMEAIARRYDDAILAAPREAEDWSRGVTWRLEPDALLGICGFYRRCLTLVPADRVDDGALGDHPWAALARDYQQRPVEERVLVVDDFLAPEALDRLQRYSLDSTIWHNDAQKGRNYLGAYQLSGFRPPLIDQIAQELSAHLGPVIGRDRCEQVWAYKTIRGTSAIGVHADFANTNVNFWITPDHANRDRSCGGLILYRRAAPLAWGFADYNDDEDRIGSMVAGAERIVIPYRCNRAVIFDARLFHGSDRIHFGEAYADLRVNVTLLFGRR